MIYYNVNSRLYTKAEITRLHKKLSDGIKIYTSSRNTYKETNRRWYKSEKDVYIVLV